MDRQLIRRAFVAFAILAASLFVVGMSGRPPPLRPGVEVPGFSLPDPTGRTVGLDSYRGRPVLIHFWASWCKPCRKELPEIEAAYRDLRQQGLEVLAVNAGDDRQTAQAFAERLGLTFPILLDEHWDTATDYGVIGLPITFFVGRDGKVMDVVAGGTLTRASLAGKLREYHMIVP